MVATVEVEKQDRGQFGVIVREAGSRSTHRVTLPEDYYQKLTGGKVPPEELVRRSFEFLLEREPKESILSHFDLPVIAHYFPEYESEIRNRLGT